MSFLKGGLLKSHEKASSVLIVLIVFVSLLLGGESSYGTPPMRTAEIVQLKVQTGISAQGSNTRNTSSNN